MARNIGNKSRKAVVKKIRQLYNPATGNFIKRDSTTGKFMIVKKEDASFEVIRHESSSIKSNPNVRKSTALKAEKAVIAVKNAINAQK